MSGYWQGGREKQFYTLLVVIRTSEEWRIGEMKRRKKAEALTPIFEGGGCEWSPFFFFFEFKNSALIYQF